MIQEPADTAQTAGTNLHNATADSTLHADTALATYRRDSLPVRELHLSDRPDTLEIPGLHATSPSCSPDSLAPCYEMGFFQNDSLLHTEAHTRDFGFMGLRTNYSMRGDGFVSCFLLVSFLIYSYIAYRIIPRLSTLTKDFLFPSRNNTEGKEQKVSPASLLLIAVALSLIGGLAALAFILEGGDILSTSVQPYLVVGLSAAAILLAFIVRAALYFFVNWVFFDKQNRAVWRRAMLYLLNTEYLLLFPVALIVVYTQIEFQIASYVTLFVLVLAKMLLFYKTFQIFFRKLYGILHLFVYFCTLEIMPLLIMWKILTLAAAGLNV